MNTLAAPFVCELPEVDAFFCCVELFQNHIPLYVDKDTQGSTVGVEVCGDDDDHDH